METTKQIFNEMEQNNVFHYFVPIIVMLFLFVLASILFLGSFLSSLILTILVSFGILISTYRIGFSLLIISMMIDLPFFHIPSTESLALRIYDIVLLTLFLKTIITKRSNYAIEKTKFNKKFEMILILSYISIIFSLFMAMLGGTINYKYNISFVAITILTGMRSLGYTWLLYFTIQYINPKDRIFFLNFIYLSIFIACLYALAEYLNLVPSLWQSLPNPWRIKHWQQFGGKDIVGTFNKSHVQLGLVTMYGFLLGCVPFLYNTKRRSTYFVMQIVILIALLISQKRAAIPAIIVGSIVLFLLWNKKEAKLSFVWLVVGCSLLVTTFISTTEFATVVDSRIAPVVEGIREKDIYSSTGGRLNKWEEGWTFLKRVPKTILFGQGLNFHSVFDNDIFYMELGFQDSIQSHNEWLSLIIERGILGLLVVSIFLFIVLQASFNMINTKKTNDNLYGQALISFICAGLIFSNASRVFTVNDPTGSFLGIFMITVALVLGDQIIIKTTKWSIKQN